MVIFFSVLSVLTAAGGIILHQKKYGTALYLLALCAVCVVGGTGMNFSPSFTAIFLFVFYLLKLVSETAYAFKEKTILLRIVSFLFSIVGMLFVFPSVFIYAVGDDLLQNSVLATLILGVIFTALESFAMVSWKKGLICSILSVAELFLYNSATLFTVLSSFSSSALIPYGIGVALMTIACFRKNEVWRRIFVYAGMLVSAIFLVAPMMF